VEFCVFYPKNIIKRILSGIIAITLCSGYVFAEEYQADVRVGFEAELMEALGVMENKNLDEEMLRVDFIQMLSKMTFYGEDYTNVATDENPYIDVDNYHYAAYNIERLSQMGIMSGDGNDYANINDKITFDEAYVLMLNAAGYGKVAESYGAYPDNYRKLADETELNEDIPANVTFTKDIAAKLLVNLMEIQTMKTSISENVVYEKDMLFMEEKMGITFSEGVLQGAGNLTIIKNSISDDYVLINGKTMENGYGEKAKELVGYNVRYYHTDDNERFIYAYPRKNNVLTIKSEDIVEYKELTYTYYDEQERERDADIDTAAKLVINEVVSEKYLDFIPAYGEVKLIDNDSDEDYDVVLVDNYEVAWVSGVMDNTLSLSFENTLHDGTNLINLEEYNEYKIFDEDGAEGYFESISENQLVSIKRYEKEKIAIHICNESKTGKLSKVLDKDSYYEITLDGEIYRMTKNPYKKGWDGKVGVSVTVFFDMRGQVGAIVQNTDDTWMYGYVVKGKEYISENTGLTAVKLKLLSQSGAIENYIIEDEKLRVDGVKTVLSVVSADFTLNRLIRYKTKDSKITAVDFPIDYSVTNTTELPLTNSNDILLRRAAGSSLIYRTGTELFHRNTASNEVDGDIVPRNTGVPVFYVPDKGNIETAQDRHFYVKKVSDLKTDTKYTAEGYNTDSNDVYCDAVVVIITAEDKIQSDGSSPMIIARVDAVLNGEEEQVYKISGYVDGTEYSYLSSADIGKDLSKVLATGDIVKFAYNTDNEITDYKIIYSKRGGGVVDEKNSNTAKFDKGHIERYAIGYAQRIKDGVLQFNNLDDDHAEYFKLNKFTSALLFDVSNKKAPVKLGNSNNILTKENYGENCDKVLILTRYGVPRCIWIIRE